MSEAVGKPPYWNILRELNERQLNELKAARLPSIEAFEANVRRRLELNGLEVVGDVVQCRQTDRQVLLVAEAADPAAMTEYRAHLLSMSIFAFLVSGENISPEETTIKRMAVN